MSEVYDSTADTLKHVRRVQELLGFFAIELIRRGAVHDNSKLGPEEKPTFDEFTPRLKGLTYGSPEYRAILAEMKPAVDHHNKNNSHHPEHHGSRGVNGMDLADLVEMFFDWKAASERHADGNIGRSIQVNIERFGLDPMIVSIFSNTARRLGWLEPDAGPWRKSSWFYDGDDPEYSAGSPEELLTRGGPGDIREVAGAENTDASRFGFYMDPLPGALSDDERVFWFRTREEAETALKEEQARVAAAEKAADEAEMLADDAAEAARDEVKGG